ncbi:acetamidase/formamidase family protein [Bacillus sp. JCM 19047]|nr:acetamidase/formamidase family protein [Bacillus sp. JCM 19047]
MTIHYLNPNKESLHNAFNCELETVLSIQSGDHIIFKTLDSGWGKEKRQYAGEARSRWTDLVPEKQAPFFGHALTGPVWIEGAMPGDTLELKIIDLRPSDWGWASAGGFKSEWNNRLAIEEQGEVLYDFYLDLDKMKAYSQFGLFDMTIPISPFIGIIGMPPKEKGFHTSFVPRETGGNLDCKELGKGSTLYLPIEVEGGILSVGDGHAVQGNGEISGPALECPMEKVHLQINLLKSQSIKRPRVVTKDGYITLAFHEDLNEAMWLALNDMLEWMQELYSMTKVEASLWGSLAIDLSITQIVNGKKGVHASLMKEKLRRV